MAFIFRPLNIIFSTNKIGIFDQSYIKIDNIDNKITTIVDTSPRQHDQITWRQYSQQPLFLYCWRISHQSQAFLIRR